MKQYETSKSQQTESILCKIVFALKSIGLLGCCEPPYLCSGLKPTTSALKFNAKPKQMFPFLKRPLEAGFKRLQFPIDSYCMFKKIFLQQEFTY